MARPDLSDRPLTWLIAAACGAIVVWFALVLPQLPEVWRRPGTPPLYLTGVAGTLLLFVAFAFVAVKRGGGGARAPLWFVAHVVAATIGLVLVAVHSAGALGRPAALMYLLLIALVALGVWARVHLSAQIAATFGARHSHFAPLPDTRKAELRRVIAAKEALLRRLDPGALEGTFSVTLPHLLRAPTAAIAYARLVRAERRLMGTRAMVSPTQGYWRWVHMGLAYLFFAAVLLHVVVVTFFAGYVADGGPIRWWHITAW